MDGGGVWIWTAIGAAAAALTAIMRVWALRREARRDKRADAERATERAATFQGDRAKTQIQALWSVHDAIPALRDCVREVFRGSAPFEEKRQALARCSDDFRAKAARILDDDVRAAAVSASYRCQRGVPVESAALFDQHIDDCDALLTELEGQISAHARSLEAAGNGDDATRL